MHGPASPLVANFHPLRIQRPLSKATKAKLSEEDNMEGNFDNNEAPPMLVDSEGQPAVSDCISSTLDDLSISKVPITVVTGT
jgi:hypothetical protein